MLYVYKLNEISLWTFLLYFCSIKSKSHQHIVLCVIFIHLYEFCRVFTFISCMSKLNFDPFFMSFSSLLIFSIFFLLFLLLSLILPHIVFLTLLVATVVVRRHLLNEHISKAKHTGKKKEKLLPHSIIFNRFFHHLSLFYFLLPTYTFFLFIFIILSIK